MDVARAEHGNIRVRCERIDLSEVVRRALESLTLAGRAERHRIERTLADEPVFVSGDATRLDQVVRNLLDNAVKYSPAGTTIRVSVEAEAGAAVLRVADQGIGMSGETLPRLFEPFAQADGALDRAAGGLGLGLPLVRAIVEAHGGHVSASSAGRGRGSEFVVRLPLAPPGALDRGVAVRSVRRP
jgi:two-component system CheB/CheR fusion protein